MMIVDKKPRCVPCGREVERFEAAELAGGGVVVRVHCHGESDSLEIPPIKMLEKLAFREAFSDPARAIAVVSTAYAAETEMACRKSVYAQRGVSLQHIYVDAAKQPTPLAATENLFNAVNALKPWEIVAHIDGDDWLSSPDALAHVLDVYAKHPETLVTYGQFVTAEGAPGFASKYSPSEDIRKTPWRATHLRTFRAGLFQRIATEDLQHEGAWLRTATDLAVMFPLLEMAGPDRSRFIPEVLYVYNTRASFEQNATRAQLEGEASDVAAVRAKKPYERLSDEEVAQMMGGR